MNITLPKEHFLSLVNNVSRIVNHSSHIAALQGIRLEVRKNTLTCSVSNIEMSVVVEVEGGEGVDGVCVVPARVFVEVLKNTRNERVQCVSKDGVLYIRNPSQKGGSNTKITLLPTEDFPVTPIHTTETVFTIPASVFVSGFNYTLFAVSPSTIKPELACVSVRQVDSHIVFVSTDSFRLAEKKVPYQGEDEVPSILLPGKNAQELSFFLSLQGDNEVLWYFDETMLAVRVGDYYITSRLVTGTYPDYQRIIPKEFSTSAQFITNDLQYIFKKASLFSDITRQISVELVPEKNECLFRSKNATVGEFDESIPARITGESLGLNFNSKYVSDCLQYIKEDGVECKFAGPGKPLVMKGINNESFLYLVMPMNR